MKATLRRGAAMTLTALVFGTGLAACGSGNSGSPAAPPGGSSVAASGSPTGTATQPAGSTASAPAPGSSVDAATMTQKLRHAAEVTQSAHVVMSLDMAGQSVRGQGDVQTKPEASDLTMSLMGSNVEVRLVDGAFYIKLPAAAGLGDAWLKATPQQLGSAAGTGTLGGSMTDPLAVFTKLGDALQSSTYVGADSTGQHYAVKVDTTKMMHIMGMPSSAQSQLSGTLARSVDEDVWFDAEGHVVKAKVDLGSVGTMTATMSDFGKLVHVTPPPANQTRDFSGLGSHL